VSSKKLMCGSPLEVLGVDIRLSELGVHMLPSKDKIMKWLPRLHAILHTLTLDHGEASKLSGALSWAGSRAFKRLGRAMLVPFRRHIRRDFQQQQLERT